MIYIMFLATVVLAIICFRNKCAGEAQGETKSLRYLISAAAFDLLVPLAGVTLLYSILSYTLSDMGSDQVTLGTLRRYEEWVQTIQGWTKYLKLSTGYSVLLLGACFIFSLVLRSRGGGEAEANAWKAYGKYEVYNKRVGRISLVVALLASFTFFGGQVDRLGGEVQAHIKDTKDNYNYAVGKVEEAAKLNLALEIMQNIRDAAPGSYQQAIDLSQKTRQDFDSIKSYKDKDLPRLRELKSQRQQTEKKLEGAAAEPASKTESEPATEPRNQSVNRNKLRELTKHAESLKVELATEVKSVFDTPMGDKVLSKAVGAVISHDNVPMLQSFAEEVPLLKFIFSVFTDAISKKIQQVFKGSVRKMAEGTIKEPDLNLRREVKAGTKAMVTELNIDWRAASNRATETVTPLLREKQSRVAAAKSEVRAAVSRENRELLVEAKSQWGLGRQEWDDFVREIKRTPDPFEQNDLILTRRREQPSGKGSDRNPFGTGRGTPTDHWPPPPNGHPIPKRPWDGSPPKKWKPPIPRGPRVRIR